MQVRARSILNRKLVWDAVSGRERVNVSLVEAASIKHLINVGLRTACATPI